MTYHTILAALAFPLAVALWSGCRGDAPTTTPPTTVAMEAAAPATPTEPAVAALAFDAVVADWERDGTPQLGWVAVFDAAEQPAELETALRVLGRSLGEWRGAGISREVVDAVQRFASPAYAEAWRAIDGRYVPPAVEVLLDTGDLAAIGRLTEAFSTSPAGEALRGPATIVERARMAATPVYVFPPEGCDGTLFEGSGSADRPTALVRGSYWIACEGEWVRGALQATDPALRF